MTIEPSELAHTPDSDDEDAELLFLPVVLEPDPTVSNILPFSLVLMTGISSRKAEQHCFVTQADDGEGSLVGADDIMAIDEKQSKSRKRTRLSGDGRR